MCADVRFLHTRTQNSAALQTVAAHVLTVDVHGSVTVFIGATDSSHLRDGTDPIGRSDHQRLVGLKSVGFLVGWCFVAYKMTDDIICDKVTHSSDIGRTSQMVGWL